jgi:urease accessory protein
MTAPLALVRLLQLASPALPVGAYTYSQGLEWACECGMVKDETSAAHWIGDVLETTQRGFEAPVLRRMLDAWRADDVQGLREWNALYLASRETSELRAETVQMGYSMVRLLADLEMADASHIETLGRLQAVAFPTAWSCAAAAAGTTTEDALSAYVWSWLENQVMATVKALPLGQSAGQRLLRKLP